MDMKIRAWPVVIMPSAWPGTLIFRHTYLGASSEMGINCVAEAGARLAAESNLMSGQERVPAGISLLPSLTVRSLPLSVNSPTLSSPTLSFERDRAESHIGLFAAQSWYTKVSSSLQRGIKEMRNFRTNERALDIRREFSKGHESYTVSKSIREHVPRLQENRSAFEKYRIIPRVLVPVTHLGFQQSKVKNRSVDMRCSFFGIDLRFPVMIAPSAMHGQAHEDGEKATARAAVRAGSAFTLSSLGSMSMEAIVKKAEALGYRALCLTVDAPITGRRERDLRSGFTVSDAMGQLPNIQMLGNVVNQQLVEFEAQKDLTLDWSIITWLKSICNLPVIAKGILHPADARCAIKAGAAAIVISNHGGRQLDSTPATIDVLPAIAAEVRGEIPIFLDGGIRRGTDVFKALGPGGPAETAQTEATEATFGSCGGF
ncbi:unnamed protein product [Durusdinium trenchii]|uniref:FMN hydroxy acid dehydrogenase domain-containing protein n=1 Tax=Durusdinium trenchii TaxID=1381693 RepID=A0ABP0MPI6_9DINO